ncbi:tripartite tricarboxylate transporter TctB family protein [Halarsenatibacter silvermanii]|uniref:Tripartite tricarboxylate transporter TctB family protein n=1 Tax=Halarsenatibacter silvermanii TaxID=321763 RepID=A0A1G9RJE5_9FIRM|nr:tripartite tricarboxylate transporter TctB family protein [Halarsenatibacter silvermanii]SDM23281.1 Tripartite tricarboxylate transporter TctB family protein [Halarsenatibacter silvermanii]
MKLVAELIFLLALTIASLIFYLQIGEFPGEGWDELGPAAYPRLILLVMLAILLYLIVNNLRKIYRAHEKNDLKFSSSELKRALYRYHQVVISIILFFVYMTAIGYIGFKISTFGYMFITQWILSSGGKKALPKIIIASLVIGFGVPLIFETYLGVAFPRGFFFQ